MKEYALILVGTVLVNNFVLVKFLGLCPFMGVSRKLETATGMGLATTFVLTQQLLLTPVVAGIVAGFHHQVDDPRIQCAVAASFSKGQQAVVGQYLAAGQLAACRNDYQRWNAIYLVVVLTAFKYVDILFQFVADRRVADLAGKHDKQGASQCQYAQGDEALLKKLATALLSNDKAT